MLIIKLTDFYFKSEVSFNKTFYKVFGFNAEVL